MTFEEKLAKLACIKEKRPYDPAVCKVIGFDHLGHYKVEVDDCRVMLTDQNGFPELRDKVNQWDGSLYHVYDDNGTVVSNRMFAESALDTFTKNHIRAASDFQFMLALQQTAYDLRLIDSKTPEELVAWINEQLETQHIPFNIKTTLDICLD